MFGVIAVIIESDEQKEDGAEKKPEDEDATKVKYDINDVLEATIEIAEATIDLAEAIGDIDGGETVEVGVEVCCFFCA
ncbi:hypothetical protein GOBAR_AA32962 [Gossypium barbadense]|uniref:Uncharacterized protein n=1 Tax=Gossypium barbadense TaxID=3634 RepID=A0A2P5W9D8_GOSBA|nr:hypothetical protein GOBAR_AA32962 [Gossypium barbadense]